MSIYASTVSGRQWRYNSEQGDRQETINIMKDAEEKRGGVRLRNKDQARSFDEMILKVRTEKKKIKVRTEGLEKASPTQVWEGSILGHGNSISSFISQLPFHR